MHSLGKTLLAFALLHFVLQDQSCLLLQVSLDFLLLHPSPRDEKDISLFFFFLLVLEGLVGLQRLFDVIFSSISGFSIDLSYCDVGLFNLERDQDHCVIFDITHKYCILDSFVVYEGYSIPLKDSCLQ